MSEAEQVLSVAERHELFLKALSQKDRDGAMRQVEAFLAQAPEMTGKYCALAASLLQQQGQLDLAARLYENAIAFDPDDTAARFYLGIALQSLQRVPEARQQWAEIALRRPDSAEAQLQSALVCIIDGDRDGARKVLEMLLAGLPANKIWQYDAMRVLNLLNAETSASL